MPNIRIDIFCLNYFEKGNRPIKWINGRNVFTLYKRKTCQRHINLDVVDDRIILFIIRLGC